jgi:peroxiredoxin
MTNFLYILSIVLSLTLFGASSYSQVTIPHSTSSDSTLSKDDTIQTLSAFGRYFNVTIDESMLYRLRQAELQTGSWLRLVALVQASRLPFEARLVVTNKLQDHGVVLVRLRTPEQYAIVQAVGSHHTLLLMEGHERLIEKNEFTKLYTGEALVWSGSKDVTWKIKDPVRFLKVDTIGGASALVETIPLHNFGTKSLTVEVTSTSCGCTGATVSPKVLPPGGHGILTARMHTGDSRLVIINLRSDDPHKPRAVIALKSQVPEGVTPPATLILSSQKGQVSTASTNISLPPNSVVTRVSTRHVWLQASLNPIKPAALSSQKPAYRLDVLLRADAPAGRLQDEVMLELKSGVVRKIVVPVDGYISNDITVEPSLVMLGNTPRGRTLRKTVIVRGPANQPFSIKSITSSSERVSGKADPSVVATAHAVDILVSVLDEVGASLQERVTLHLSDARSLDVDLVGTISGEVKEASEMQMLHVGQVAPDFSFIDSNDGIHHLSDLKGRKNLLLTFFPQCFTGGCAGQLSSLQRELPNFTHNETEVWAVSVDPAEDQAAFATELGLQFPLLSDTERKISLLYGASQDKTDLAARQSILIDKIGVIRWIDTDINVRTHGADMLVKIRELNMTK